PGACGVVVIPDQAGRRRDGMADVIATTTAGQATVLDTTAVTAFQTRLRGVLLSPGADGYDAARKVWNGKIDRRPTLIARCTGVADVMEAVHFARAHHLLVAVRGGGHNAAGHATCEGGIIIDLTPMK